MAITWLYLSLTFSRLGLRNLGMWAWARTLKVYKVFTKVGWGPWLNRKLCLGPAGVINCTPRSTLSFWVSLFPRAFSYNKNSCKSTERPHLNQEEPGHTVVDEAGCILQYFWALPDLNVVFVLLHLFSHCVDSPTCICIYLICMLMKNFYLILFCRVLVKKFT